MTSNVPTTSQMCPKMFNPVPRTCQAFSQNVIFGILHLCPKHCRTCAKAFPTIHVLGILHRSQRFGKMPKSEKNMTNLSQNLSQMHPNHIPTPTTYGDLPKHHFPKSVPNIPTHPILFPTISHGISQNQFLRNFWDVFGMFLFPPVASAKYSQLETSSRVTDSGG